MTMFKHQLAAGASLSQARHSGAAVSGAVSNFTRHLTRRVQAALMQHSQAYVQHVEITFNDDAGRYLLQDVDVLERFRRHLNTAIGQNRLANGLGVKAELRCEWFSTNSHQEWPNLHLLVFVGQKAFYLLGDESEPSPTMLNRHIGAVWAGVWKFIAQHEGHLSKTASRGGFYLSDKAGDSGVAALIEAMRSVAECRCVCT